MKTSKRISILILLSLVYHRQAKATFPVDNIRVSFTFPSIAVMDTPKTAWYMFALAFKVWMMALYLGLPRVPARRPIREMSPSFTSSSYFQLHTISRSTMTFYLDVSKNEILYFNLFFCKFRFLLSSIFIYVVLCRPLST